MKIFLVAGKAGSGKGEVAKVIKEFYTYKKETVVITEFSKYLKLMAKEITDWDGNPETKPRKFLQELGDIARDIDSKYLIGNMIQDLKVFGRTVDNVIIADVRFPEELEDIKLNFDNVYTIYVENQFSASTLSIEEQSHITETALEGYDDFDYILPNDDFSKLKDKVFKFLEGIN